jgi:hypothetical protein
VQPIYVVLRMDDVQVAGESEYASAGLIKWALKVRAAQPLVWVGKQGLVWLRSRGNARANLQLRFS